MEIILFISSNPSTASTCDIAFHGSTKSSQILTSWCKDIIGTKVHINVMNVATNNNRPLQVSEVKANLPRLADDIKSLKPDKIVALGKTAANALTLLRLDFYEMPHPSGCNRKLNDKNFVEQKVKELTEFCNSVSPKITST